MTKKAFNIFENTEKVMEKVTANNEIVLNMFKNNYDTTVNLYESVIEGTSSFVEQNNDYLKKLTSMITEIASDKSLDNKNRQEKIKELLKEFTEHNKKFLAYTSKTQKNSVKTVKDRGTEMLKEFQSLFNFDLNQSKKPDSDKNSQ